MRQQAVLDAFTLVHAIYEPLSRWHQGNPHHETLAWLQRVERQLLNEAAR